MSAFDDNISISTPCETEFEGGVNGAVLITTVDRSAVSEMTTKVEKQAVHFKLGPRINLKLPTMHIDDRQFTMPDADETGKAALKVDKDQFHRALKFCLQSVGHDVTHPEWCGVTFQVMDQDLHIYGGDGQVLVQAIIPLKAKAKFKRVILHEKFCQQVLAYPKASLELYNDHALLNEEGVVKVFGRALTGSGGIELHEMIDVAVQRVRSFVGMPDITRMLNRAMIFEGDHLNMKLSVEHAKAGARLKMVSASGEGQLVDFSKVLEGEHDEIEVNTNPKHLRTGAALNEICIGPNEVVMRGGSVTQIVSVSDR